jgi:hypothetical protein
MHGSRSWVAAIALVALSVACFPPARRGHAEGANATPAQRQELQSKVDRVRSGMQQMRSRGEDPRPVVTLMQDVPDLIKQGRIDEALARTDRALAIVEPGYEPDTPRGPHEPGPSAPLPPGAPSAPGWRHASRDPVMDILRRPSGLPSDVADAPLTNWNDPSVLKEGDHYTMWASLGRKGGGKDVSIWKFTSRDGLDWRVVGDGPVLEGSRGWDAYGVETPAVIKVGGTYHMYYTAYKKAGGHLFTMGHATSPDGDRWTKQGELTSLTRVVGEKDGNPWGWLARAEPTAVYVDGTFWLYFADVHCRVDGCKGGVPMAQRGISLAKSRDGQSFTQDGDEPVLLQSASYPPSEGWEGYSTPWVLHDGSTFHLFADVFRVDAVDKHYQTRIAHYESDDGIHFREVQADVVRVEGHPWATKSVRAPTVIRDGGRWLMWYAGDNFDQSSKPKDMLGAIRSGRIRMGIAMATSD